MAPPTLAVETDEGGEIVVSGCIFPVLHFTRAPKISVRRVKSSDENVLTGVKHQRRS